LKGWRRHFVDFVSHIRDSAPIETLFFSLEFLQYVADLGEPVSDFISMFVQAGRGHSITFPTVDGTLDDAGEGWLRQACLAILRGKGVEQAMVGRSVAVVVRIVVPFRAFFVRKPPCLGKPFARSSPPRSVRTAVGLPPSWRRLHEGVQGAARTSAAHIPSLRAISRPRGGNAGERPRTHCNGRLIVAAPESQRAANGSA